MDHITSKLETLDTLSDEEISELQGTILSEFEAIKDSDLTPESVDTMTQLADHIDTLKGEVSRREVQAEELSTRAAEAANRIKGEEIVEEVVGDDSTPEQTDSEETPAIEDEEEKKLKNVASTTVDAASEFSTTDNAEVEAPAETEAAVEKTPVVEDEAPAEAATEETTTEVEPTEAATEETVAEEAAPETEASAEAANEAEASTTEITEEHNAQEEAQIVTATDEAVQPPAGRRSVAQVTEAPVAITAGADIQGYTAGSSLTDMNEVAEAMTRRLRAVRNANGGDGEQLIVASINTEYPEERVLTADETSNSEKIKALVGKQALVASGGFAAPLNTSYDIFGIEHSDARPVRDALPRFQADRGGIRYIKPPVLSSYANAVGIWTNANDVAAAGRYDGDAGTPDGPVKNLLVVGGATTEEELTYAVTLQLQFGNLMTRAFPELIARHNELALVQHARQAELALLAKIASKSTAVTAASTLGFARDFVNQLRRAAVQYRSRNRLDRDGQLRAIVPTWVVDAMAADMAMQMPGDDALSKGRAEIAGYLSSFNIQLTESLDQNSFGAQTAGALNNWPTDFTWFLFAEGTFLFLDGGTLDLGIIRDSGLVGTNDYRMFTETFEGVAKVGVESLAITSQLRVNGAAAALQNTI